MSHHHPAEDLLARVFTPSLVKAFGEAIEPAVEAALARVLPEAIRRAATPEFQSRKQAAAYIGRSIRSLDRLRSSGTIPYSKRGGRVVFATADLDTYLAAGRVPATPDR
ncbi:MAG: helix-turn-helix domain-containing protein [Bacteroidota bacterium]